MSDRRKLDVEFATTQDIMDAADVSRRTVWLWIQRGLLPTPTMVSLGNPGGTFNRFPAHAVGIARFIVAKRADGLTLDEIKAHLDAEDEERSSRARRPAVASRDAAPTPARPSPRRR
jgi:DNA-binding transcriptional MerR regulator